MEDHLSKFDIPIKTNPKDMFVEWEYIPFNGDMENILENIIHKCMGILLKMRMEWVNNQ